MSFTLYSRNHVYVKYLKKSKKNHAPNPENLKKIKINKMYIIIIIYIAMKSRTYLIYYLQIFI